MAYAFQSPEKLFMVMDLVEGGDMYAHMQKQKRFVSTFFYILFPIPPI
jgi:hypothetical protein